jgi:TIR domain
MLKLFISYRVDDSVHATMALADQLAKHYGAENVFRDRDSLPLGALYPRRIRRALEQCDTVLAVIGPRWLDVRDSKNVRRLDNPRDWVRTELRMAFDRGIPVVPVLLDQTPLPPQEKLPAEIRLLSLSTYWQVRNRSFAADVRELIENLSPAAGEGVPRPPASGNVQHNLATGESKLFVNQGGNQSINWTDGGTKR